MKQGYLFNMRHDKIMMPVTVGEVVDRWLITKLKWEKTGAEHLLEEIKDMDKVLAEDLDWAAVKRLEKLHAELWDIEDFVRVALTEKDKELVFVLSEKIVQLNGERIKLKNHLGGRELKHYK